MVDSRVCHPGRRDSAPAVAAPQPGDARFGIRPGGGAAGAPSPACCRAAPSAAAARGPGPRVRRSLAGAWCSRSRATGVAGVAGRRRTAERGGVEQTDRRRGRATAAHPTALVIGGSDQAGPIHARHGPGMPPFRALRRSRTPPAIGLPDHDRHLGRGARQATPARLRQSPQCRRPPPCRRDRRVRSSAVRPRSTQPWNAAIQGIATLADPPAIGLPDHGRHLGCEPRAGRPEPSST